MSEKLNFIWIDDQESRITQNNYLDSNKLIECEFIPVREEDLLKLLNDEIFPNEEPDLILIDHKLTDVKNELKFSGASYAKIIREQWPECPIVAVTAIVNLIEDTTFQQRESYDEILRGHQIKSKQNLLVAIARSNKEIARLNKYLKNNKPEHIIKLLKLLKSSKDDIDKLEMIIPENVILNLGKKDLTFELSKWIRKILFVRPGFLYDKLWTSTMLGIKETSFEKIEHFFTDAKYKGLYHNDDNVRWWQSKIKEILFSEFPDDEEYLPWKLGHNLDGVEDADHSLCHVCKDKYPETIAYTDMTMKKRAPMHIRCTKPNPYSPKMLYFEEIRIMRDSE